MLGYLLARSGIQVTVLEQHSDFFRDFRGDTVHPSTLEVLYELGLLEDFLRVPHQQVTSVGGVVGDFAFMAADFRHVPAHCKFVAFMPQWDFLNFLSAQGKKLPTFDLRLQHKAIDLAWEGDRVSGVVARGPGETQVEIHADLVVGCDGRHSVVRKAGRLELIDHGVPIDVLWFRISRRPGDPRQVLGNVNYGKVLILIDRNDYFQAGLIIPKGTFEQVRQRGIDALKAGILQVAPYLGERVNELRDWDQIRILTVQINRLRRWYRAGLLCVGDAAHAMSPAGGVGINLAIQDAVATANLLARPLLEKRVTEADLAAVQARREFPTRITQAVQVQAHKGLAWAFRNPGPIKAPWLFRAAVQVPGIHQLLAYTIGIGVRPEHVQGAERPARRKRSRVAIAIGIAAGVAAAIFALQRKGRRRKDKVEDLAIA
jgi:2-polyprenyl-6-methoxyphenol hydroxylase-like FAD-dependent oxidoreductase